MSLLIDIRNLNPGGWIEVVDITFPALSDDGTLTPDSPFSKWCNLMIEAANNLGRSLESAKSYKEQLEAVGFKNTVQVVHKWPQNTWPRDHKYKELGKSASASHIKACRIHYDHRNVGFGEHQQRSLWIEYGSLHSWPWLGCR